MSFPVLYCDYCKINALQCSKAFDLNEDGAWTWKAGDACPECGEELAEAESLEDIP